MDVFKLAFETTIVGISAFLWVGIAILLISPNFLTRIRSTLAGVNQSLIGAVLLAAAYCLGSAILPISAQLVNDEHWPLPEDSLRCRVVVEEGRRLSLVNTRLPNHSIPEADTNACACSYWTHLRGGDTATGKKNSLEGAPLAALAVNRGTAEENSDQQTKANEQRKLLTKFELQETRALGQGANKEELFRQLRERIIVLRGAVFNGFVLFLICLFGCIAPEQGQPFNWRRTFPGIMLASCLTVFVIHSGYQDLMNPNIFDIPVLEAVLGTITVFGGFLAVNGVRHSPFLQIRFLVVIALAAALAYGGWIWSEVLYDQQVISFSAILETHPAPSTIQPGIFSDPPAFTSGSPETVYQASKSP